EQFVTSICNMANVIIFADEAQKVVRFISFDGILNSEYQDLSNKLVLNKPIKSTNTIQTYFQNNELSPFNSPSEIVVDVADCSIFAILATVKSPCLCL
ncbi:unnamed protein product, partial [marine sediment metagenome]